MFEQVLGLATLISVALSPSPQVLLSPIAPQAQFEQEILAEHQLNLTDRNKNSQINEVFSFNILKALEYFCQDLGEGGADCQNKNFSFALEPGEVFVFHQNVLSEFAGSKIKTSRTEFSSSEGYKTVLGLSGNGVCHLASLLNWVATDAGLEVIAKVSHNFAPIPEIPKEFGTSIRTLPESANTQNQNLYIKNNFDYPVEFEFAVEKNNVVLKIIKFSS